MNQIVNAFSGDLIGSSLYKALSEKRNLEPVVEFKSAELTDAEKAEFEALEAAAIEREEDIKTMITNAVIVILVLVTIISFIILKK